MSDAFDLPETRIEWNNRYMHYQVKVFLGARWHIISDSREQRTACELASMFRLGWAEAMQHARTPAPPRNYLFWGIE